MNGSLDDYSPAGALRVLASSGKTGAVRFSGDGGCTVYLHRGQLYFARDERTDEAIVNALVRPGRLTAEAWTAAVAEAGQLPQIGELLVAQGAIEDDLLASVVLSVVYDPLIRLFREGDGEFEFEPDVVHWIGPFRTFNVDAIVNEVRRRVRQVDEMVALVPTLDAVVTAAATLPDGATQVTLLREDWEVVVGLDATGSTVTEVAERLGRGRYSAARVVHRLAQAGLVSVTVDLAEAEPAAEEPAEVAEVADAAVLVADAAVDATEVEVDVEAEAEDVDHLDAGSIWDEPTVEADTAPAEADDPFASLRQAVTEDESEPDAFGTVEEAAEADDDEVADPWAPSALDEEPETPSASPFGQETFEGVTVDLSEADDEEEPDPWASLRSDEDGPDAGSPWWDNVPIAEDSGDLASRWSEGALPADPAPSSDNEVSFALPRRVAVQEDRRHDDGDLESLAAIGGFRSAVESPEAPALDDETQQANAAWLESLYDQFMEADEEGSSSKWRKKDALDVAFHAEEIDGEEKVSTLRRLMKALKKV